MEIPKWAEKIVHEEPGKRFWRTYRRRQVEERGRPWVTVAVSVAGILLLLGGILFMALPVLPGFVLAIPGLAVLLGNTRRGAKFLDWAEVRIRSVLKRFRQGKNEED